MRGGERLGQWCKSLFAFLFPLLFFSLTDHFHAGVSGGLADNWHADCYWWRPATEEKSRLVRIMSQPFWWMAERGGHTKCFRHNPNPVPLPSPPHKRRQYPYFCFKEPLFAWYYIIALRSLALPHFLILYFTWIHFNFLMLAFLFQLLVHIYFLFV